jgi:phosphohistidine phosphatase
MLTTMKTLLILRHAKAERDESPSDHERELTKKGKKAARRMGELIKRENLLPDLILSSAAERARRTAEETAGGAAFAGETKLLEELYLAEPHAYLDSLRRLGGDAQRVLVVGHNPGIEALIFRLTGSAEHMPTAALAVCTLPIESWSELGPETTGQLRNVWRPKEVDE